MLNYHVLLLYAAWRTYAYGPGNPPDEFTKWTTTEWATTLTPIPKFISTWSICSTVEVTIMETQTILRTGSTVTVTDTSNIKSGVILNTTDIATPSALKPRHYKIQTPSWDIPSSAAHPETVSIIASEAWTDWSYCSVSTLTATSIEYTTSILPTSTAIANVIETIPASTISCSQGCKVDVTATRLIYPSSVIFVPISITVDILPESHTPEPLTWEYNGVTLTYPTTYLFYTEFSHAFLATTASASATTCPTASASLAIGSSNYAALIYPEQETPGPNLPPSALISYLNAQETVLVQLSGTPIGSSCDPVGGGIVEPVTSANGPAQVVYTSTYILAQPTSSTTSTTVTLVAIVGSTSTSTSTSSSFSVSAAATFASTVTSTVVIKSSSSTSSSAVQVVSVADAPGKLAVLGAEIWGLRMLGLVFGWL